MNTERKTIYLDHAATTPLDPRVLEAMMPYLGEHFANPSSPHAGGRRARVAVEEARDSIARILQVDSADIIFTSGGTEADNMALRGVFEGQQGGHLVTVATEHKAVLETALWLKESGVEITVLAPGGDGRVDVEQIENNVRDDTRVVSVMHTNNETGAVHPLPEIAGLCHQRGILFHTDAVQAAAWTNVSLREVDADLLTLSAHKVYGPKGVGLLVARSDRVELKRLIQGGAQERDRRGGTENVAAIVGFAAALVHADLEMEVRRERLASLRARLVDQIADRIPHGVQINGSSDSRYAAPHILNISFPPADGRRLDGEMLLLNLDVAGVLVSSGSACTSGAVEPSHVLQAMGVESDTAQATVRFSFGTQNRVEDMDIVAERLAEIVGRMRGRIL